MDTTPGGCPGKRAWYNDGRSPVQDGTIPPHKTGKEAWIGMLAEWVVFLLVVHLLSATPLFLIARKLEHPAPIAAFVPFINAWLVVELAGREWYWLLALALPLIGEVIWAILWMDIARELGHPEWQGALMVIPVLHFVLMFYFGLASAPDPGEDLLAGS